MRLNFDTLQDYLGETCRVRRFGPRSREVFFSRPLLYEGGGEMAAGGLYVARSETLPKRQPPEGVGVVCTGQRLPQVWTSGMQVLCVPGESGVLSLFNRVQEIYNCLDAWDEGLRDELERDEDFDLGRLLVLGAAQLQNPMNVVGQNLQTIFTTESQPDGDGVFHLTSGTLPPSVSADYAEEIRKVCRLELSFFQDQILQYMLDECAGKLPVESLFSPGLLSLLEHDRTRGTEYVKTLDIYLKNETSMSRTAAALYIHRSSLLKRLNKIERLIQEDLQDPDVRLYYRICFALRENRGGGTD